jgi:methyl-accepting chemotaxis protein
VTAWKNASLRTRLIASFAVPVVLLGLMGFAGQRAASHINADVEAIAAVRLPIIINLLEADRDLHQALVAERTLTLGRVTGDAGAKLRTEIAENHAQADERIGKAAALAVTPEERRFVEAFEKDRETWRAGVAAIVREAEAGRFDSAVALSVGDVGQAFGVMREHVNKLEEVSERLASEARTRADETFRSNRLVLALVTLAGLAIAAALAWSVSRWVAHRVGQNAERIGTSAEAVAHASTQIAASAQLLSSGAVQQAASLEETSASMEELGSMTRQNAEHTSVAASTMADTHRLVRDANDALAAMTESMSAIRTSSAQVGRILKTIDEIAFQTNILALNAAVEAARAGDAGLGFAVVADEVRALAQRAAQAAQDTAALVDQSVRSAAEGEERAVAVSRVIGSITESTTRVKTLIDDISASSRQQSQGLQQIATAMAEMERVTQATAASAEEGAASSEELRASAVAATQAVDDLVAFTGGRRETAETTEPAERTTAMIGTRAAILACGVLAGSVATASAQDFTRWVDVQTFSVAARYKFVQDDRDTRTTHDLQDNSGFKARVKADRQGRLALNVGAFTGGGFTSSWNNTGAGPAQYAQPFNVKQLYVAALPVKGVEAQVGSLYLTRGESTEVTHFDNDGYVAGQRLTVKRPGELFVDEVTVTHGYVGDLSTPSVFDRADSLTRSNYRQLMVGKKVGARVGVSAEWTDAADRTTWRGAFAVRTPRVLDAVRVEYYARPDEDVHGGAVTAERKIVRGIGLSAGYANLDGAVGSLTGDKYGRGERLFGSVNVPVVGPLSANIFYTHALSNDFTVSNDQRFDVVVTYNVLSALQRKR